MEVAIMKNRFNYIWLSFALIITIAGVMLQFGSLKIKVTAPRPDLLPVGLILCSVILLVPVLQLLFVRKTRQQVIQEQDERNQKIAALSGSFANSTLTISLVVTIFMLIFLGYMTIMPTFTIFGVLIINRLAWYLYKHHLEQTI